MKRTWATEHLHFPGLIIRLLGIPADLIQKAKSKLRASFFFFFWNLEVSEDLPGYALRKYLFKDTVCKVVAFKGVIISLQLIIITLFYVDFEITF